MTTTRPLTKAEQDKIAMIDSVTRSVFGRDPDSAPASGFLSRKRGRVHPAVVRAQTRMRTARWRMECDRRKRPTATQIGLALVEALVTAEHEHMLDRASPDFSIVKRALKDLEARGFDLRETKSALRKLRNRNVDPADREGEATESCAPALRPSSWTEADDIEALF